MVRLFNVLAVRGVQAVRAVWSVREGWAGWAGLAGWASVAMSRANTESAETKAAQIKSYGNFIFELLSFLHFRFSRYPHVTVRKKYNLWAVVASTVKMQIPLDAHGRDLRLACVRACLLEGNERHSARSRSRVRHEMTAMAGLGG